MLKRIKKATVFGVKLYLKFNAVCWMVVGIGKWFSECFGGKYANTPDVSYALDDFIDESLSGYEKFYNAVKDCF